MEPTNHPFRRKMIFQTFIIMFHVNLPGCRFGGPMVYYMHCLYLYLVHLQQLTTSNRSLATDPFLRISHLLKGHRACGTLELPVVTTANGAKEGCKIHLWKLRCWTQKWHWMLQMCFFLFDLGDIWMSHEPCYIFRGELVERSLKVTCKALDLPLQ